MNKVQKIDFICVSEKDGNLIFWEGNKEIPFDIKRIFYIQKVPKGCERANHASVNSDFVLIAINGTLTVTVVNQEGEKTYLLNTGSEGLYIPRMTWMKTSAFSENAILLVVSNKEYKETKYISDYDVFLNMTNDIREVNT